VGTRLQRAVDDHEGETVVVVGHGGTIGASFVAFGHLPMLQATEIVHDVHNSSITEWAGSDGRWRLVRFNDAAHLHDVA
jgi:broad specificity phosphatase PhoE